MSVSSSENDRVSVDGQVSKRKAFSTQVKLKAGREFTITEAPLGGATASYHVRCLPSDFPTWTTERAGVPQAEYYVAAPFTNTTFTGGSHYTIVYDTNGVPLWWMSGALGVPIDAKLLSNGNLAWTVNGGVEEHRLDGSMARTLRGDPDVGPTLNFHDLQLMPNGNYLLAGDNPRCCVDLSAYGGPKEATVEDNVLEQVTPDGRLVWYWSTFDHISALEFEQRFWGIASSYAVPNYDIYHWNSIELNGNDVIVSYRHLDAVYDIEMGTSPNVGAIMWKLGGTSTAKSLTVTNDPVLSSLCGQHDARVLGDGTITVHDNGTECGRAPRAVRYWIDSVSRTASVVEQVADPEAASSSCCGSARKLPGGDWVLAWGDAPFVTELAPSGTRVFRLTFGANLVSYRVDPVLPGRLKRTALRAGMDAQYPREPRSGTRVPRRGRRAR